MPSTIKDVAKAAGVSVATVSRAMNEASNIRPDTKQRVLEAAAALRFTPSGAARSLIRRRSDTIGALLPDLYGAYFSEFIRGIDQGARARGLHLLVSSSHGDASEAAAALRAMSGRVDGLLVMSPHADAEFLALNLPTGVPAVLVNAVANQPRHAAFTVDNFGGAQAMTQHLASLGRKRIAFIAGPSGNPEAAERLRGYRAALPKTAREQVYEGDFTEESGWAAGREIALAKPRPDAVFAANDMMAIGCLSALAAAGLRVPEDVAVGGFDDIPMARYIAPALTTIRVPISELGALALDALALAIESPGRKPGRAKVMSVELIVRASSGVASAATAPRRAPSATRHPQAVKQHALPPKPRRQA